MKHVESNNEAAIIQYFSENHLNFTYMCLCDIFVKS